MASEEPESPPVPPPTPPTRYAITAPGPVCGGVMGVGFANGHALITDGVRDAKALAWFQAEPGYQVTQLDPPTPEPPQEPEAPAEQPDPDPEPPIDTEEPVLDVESAPAARRRK